MAHDHIVFIVDDDRRIRESLVEPLSSFDMNAHAFGFAADYVARSKPNLPACLVLGVQLADMNGLDLRGRIAQGSAIRLRPSAISTLECRCPLISCHKTIEATWHA
jgi:FixJ family two-component response regulator